MMVDSVNSKRKITFTEIKEEKAKEISDELLKNIKRRKMQFQNSRKN